MKKNKRNKKRGPVVLKKLKIKGIKGRTTRGLHLDALRKALPPGKRRSKTGKIYIEVKANRADVNIKGKKGTWL